MKDASKAAITTLVKTLINKNSETKSVAHTCENNVYHNSAILAADIVPIVPSVPQGTDDWNRLGDSLKPLSMMLRGHISIGQEQPHGNEVLLVRVIVGMSKTFKSRAEVIANSATIASNLLKPNYDTGSSVQAFTGQAADLYLPVNNDVVRVVYDKIFEIAPSNADGQYKGLEQQPASCRRYKVKIPLPSTFNFDSGTSSTYATNFCPFMAVGYAYAGGSGPDIVATKILSQATSFLTFKDF